MVCYIFPAIGFLLHKIGQNKKKDWKDDPAHNDLSKLFLGGSLFGIIDHAWNNELFLISNNWQNDALLGITITLGILLVWSGMQAVTQKQPLLANQ